MLVVSMLISQCYKTFAITYNTIAMTLVKIQGTMMILALIMLGKSFITLTLESIKNMFTSVLIDFNLFLCLSPKSHIAIAPIVFTCRRLNSSKQINLYALFVLRVWPNMPCLWQCL